MLRLLADRHAPTLHRLLPLADDEIDEMATACAGGLASEELRAVLRRRTGGIPLLVEELLAAGVDPATAGEWAAADLRLEDARMHTADSDLRLRITTVASQVALGDSRFADAGRLAGEGLAGGGGAVAADVTCDALMVLGRIARRDDLVTAEGLFTRAWTVAEQAGLVVAATRALEELAIGEVQESLRLDRLQEARVRAAVLGDVATVAVLDLQATATLNARWEPEPALEAANRCITASPRRGVSGW